MKDIPFTIFLTGWVILAICLGTWLYFQTAHGDDTEDPVGACINGNQNICDKIDIDKLTDQILNRTIEWNKIHNNSLDCLLNDSTERAPRCFEDDQK